MKSIFVESKNCWKVATANRAALLIDGENYFRALHEAMRLARRSIMIVAWDLHSELRMIRNESCEGYPNKLGRFLDFLARNQKGLNIYLLSWDFAMIYAMEREFFPRYKLKWRSHDRIHFRLDGEHPVGASQHQKVVVVDDIVAFAGGFDLSKWRWDTTAHRPDDDARIDPDGKPYPPFHDVQMIVDGQAAKALGSLVKERWVRACGEEPVIDANIEICDPWPLSVKADLKDVKVAIARTFPAYKDNQEVREVEQLYIDSITSARKFIYIENQYLSSYRISEALKSCLQNKNGPEIVLVLPKNTGGWLEKHTMDMLRERILRELRESDRYRRLRIFYPQISADPHVEVIVHAKVMVIDDNFVRVGSSNLSNRSLGFDSECDLAIAAENHSIESEVIQTFRNRLLSEHLGIKSDDFTQAISQCNSLIKTIETFREGERTLQPLRHDLPLEVDKWIPDSELFDPERPIEPKELFDFFVNPKQRYSNYRQLFKIIFLISGLLCFGALWHWTPLRNWINVDMTLSAIKWINQMSLAPLMVVAAYLIGGILSFPLTLLIIATVIVFGSFWGIFYALLGSTLSATLIFLTGRRLGKSAVERYTGSLLNRINHRLSESGFLSVVIFRIIPVAPFSVINLIAGVSKIRLRDFVLGTLIGLVPGTAAIVVVAGRISESLRHPGFGSFTSLIAAAVVSGAFLFGLYGWLRRRYSKKRKIKGDS